MSFAAPEPPKAQPVKPPRACPERRRREKVKIDPPFIAKARELRDRYLEHVNADGAHLLSQGKYDVARALSLPTSSAALLPAA